MGLKKILEAESRFACMFNKLVDKPSGYVCEEKDASGLLRAKVLENSIELAYQKLDIGLMKKAAASAGLKFQELFLYFP